MVYESRSILFILLDTNEAGIGAIWLTYLFAEWVWHFC